MLLTVKAMLPYGQDRSPTKAGPKNSDVQAVYHTHGLSPIPLFLFFL